MILTKIFYKKLFLKNKKFIKNKLTINYQIKIYKINKNKLYLIYDTLKNLKIIFRF